jgi:tRNA threonylcarbamoyladenosine biosynthesis protein TsaB
VTTAAALDDRLVLAFDTGSPITSVAVARGGAVVVEQAVERAGSSDSLLALIDAALARAGAVARAMDAICVLRGPGSFTGLRIGLATALGLHQALGVRVAAMPTLRVLAEASDPEAERVIAVVDALRGEWFAQVFERRPELVEEGPARILGAGAVRELAAETVIGFGASRLIADLDGPRLRAMEPPPLAALAARLAAGWLTWDPALLTQPLYLRPPPTTPSARV